MSDSSVSISHNEIHRGLRTHALSSNQERRLRDYVEDKFLDITRNFKKRNHPPTTLPTLSSYLAETHSLLSIILQIPPLPPQAALRTSLLLRLTNEALSAIPCYEPISATLPLLLDWLDDLDKGWLAVLRMQAWDPNSGEGVDVEIALDSDQITAESMESTEGMTNMSLSQLSLSLASLNNPGTSSAVNQTDRTRLRSILLTGMERLETWLEGIKLDYDRGGANGNIGGDDENAGMDLESALERMGLQQRFDDLFIQTLHEMGEFSEAGVAQTSVSAC